jgi:hypothetical protein
LAEDLGDLPRGVEEGGVAWVEEQGAFEGD